MEFDALGKGIAPRIGHDGDCTGTVRPMDGPNDRPMRSRAVRTIAVAATLVVCGALLGSCSGIGDPKVAATLDPIHSVGITSFTVVDATRPTPATAVQPGAPTRTIPVRVWYPAITPSADQARDDDIASVPDPTPMFEAPPATGSGPFPLIVFSHGLGATAAGYGDLMSRWAAAGYVVVAPTFPLSSADAPGMPDAGDVANQPGDVSVVITETLARSSSGSGGALAGMVDPDRIGASGHSNGGITTVGLIASSCCRDPRIDAAIVFAGSEGLLPGGDVEWTDSVPVMVVHGTDDVILPIEEGLRIFEHASSPKWFVRLRTTDHGSFFLSSSRAFGGTADVTTAFWDRTIAGRAPIDDLWQYASLDPVEVHAVLEPDPLMVSELVRRLAGPIPSAPDRRVSASPTNDLRDGDSVTIRWSGFAPGRVVNVMQCSPGGRGGVSSCSVVTGRILVGDPSGSGSLTLEVITGPVGDGRCDRGSSTCYLAINDASSLESDANFRIPLSFAP